MSGKVYKEGSRVGGNDEMKGEIKGMREEGRRGKK